MKNVGEYDLLNKCTGCMACSNICPVEAIEMRVNKYGFFNPTVSQKCIECRKCLNVCQIDTENDYSESSHAYAIKNCDDNVRMVSSSGGAFSLLCETAGRLYEDNIFIAGAAWTDSITVEHQIHRPENVSLFRGSKYVQSDLRDVYKQIANHLKKGTWVLFSGTACQCQGLRKYMQNSGVSEEKLFLVDIICHGITPPKMWKEYISILEKHVNDCVISYSFRDKQVSWHGINPKIVTKKGAQVEIDDFVKSYGILFGNLSLNACCHECKYANLKRVGDITLGDYWGVEKQNPELDDNKGVSLCLVNTEKGRLLLESIQNAEIHSLEGKNILQPNLIRPTARNEREKQFWSDYIKFGYEYVVKKYTVHSGLYKFIRKIYRRILKR